MKLIVEMDMPRNCDECEVNYDCAFCGITGSAFYGNRHTPDFVPHESRLPDCPIKGVLPDEHGDLVDADTVLWEVLDSQGIETAMSVTVGDVIEGYDVPIVIAAERKDDGNI